MNLLKTYRKKQGFSLGELLAAVAILLVLLAIAVPAVFNIQKNIRQKALDSKAEIIYTSVQNNLVKLRNNGNSEMFGKDKAQELTANPQDADGRKKLYYVTAEQKNLQDNAASVLVTADTVDAELYGNYWVVEYNPESASVYAVFYSETRENDYDTIMYNELRYKSNRLKDGARVGYYGGDMVDTGNTSTLAPKLTITNEEKLVATISCKRPDGNPLSFEVTLKDAAGHSLTLKYKANASGTGLVHQTDDLYWESEALGINEEGVIEGIRYELKLTLDDLSEQARRFVSLYGKDNPKIKSDSKKLTPGQALTVTVKVKSDSTLVDGLSAGEMTNSLFSEKSTTEQAVILYGRHLQNLDKNSGVTDEIHSAVQQSDIHFEKQETLEETIVDTSSWYSCYKEKLFTPIKNGNLKSYNGSYAEETAAAVSTIYHLQAESGEAAGLFANLSDGMTVDSVRLSGMQIKNTGAISENSCVGAIAGKTDGSAVLKNCLVFLDSSDTEGKTAEYIWLSGKMAVGGLIGQTNGSVTIERCLSATTAGDEDACTGGLVGVANGNLVIKNSYADSYLYGKVTGGLVGESKTQVTIENCYAAGYISAKETAGGLAAKIQGTAKLQNSYTAVAWVDAYAGETEAASVVRYSTAPMGTEPEDFTENVYFLKGGTDYDLGSEEGAAAWHGEKISYKELSDRNAMVQKLGGAFVSTAVFTNAYNLKNQGLSGYSYPALSGLAHYGDWEATFEPGSLVYYEVYEEEARESYGFYGGNISSTLSDEKTVLGDGYGIAYTLDDVPKDEISILLSHGTEETVWKLNPQSAKHYKIMADQIQYVVYPLPEEFINKKAAQNEFYQKITIQGEAAVGNKAAKASEEGVSVVSGSVFYYNPHFAKTAVSSSEGASAPEVPKEISIRTARQLYQLSLWYPEYAAGVKKSTFMQEIDLDYRTYDWETYAGTNGKISVQEPIGARGNSLVAFNAVYDGKCREIRGLSIEAAETAVGFVGKNEGTLQNIFLVSDYEKEGKNPTLKYTGKISSNRIVYMGALAGINSGKMLNCAVCGYVLDNDSKIYVQRNGTLYFGGITGSNRGSIISCQGDVSKVNANILYGNAYMGGFAGENASGGVIRNSYALGNLTVEYAKGAKAVIGGFTAKNAGSLRADYCAVAMTAAGTTATYGFSPRGGSVSGDCYYLNGGTFQYLKTMYAFDNVNGSGRGLTYLELSAKGSQTAGKYHTETTVQEGDVYPYVSVVRDKDGNAVHYGNWQLPVDLGAIGILYWELEEGGSNAGYHFSYIGYQSVVENEYAALQKTSGSTLCEQHDDGGIITQYGYGFYYAPETNSEGWQTAIEQTTWNFQTGAINSEVSKALSDRLDGFTVIAYTTKPSVTEEAQVKTSETEKDYMRMKAKNRTPNGIWQFKYKEQTYTFTISPFFGDSMQYGSEKATGLEAKGVESQSLLILEEEAAIFSEALVEAMPGTADNQYSIRSADQLQYINWNYITEDTKTSVGVDKCGDNCKDSNGKKIDCRGNCKIRCGGLCGEDCKGNYIVGYTYLGYMYPKYAGSIDGYNVNQEKAKYSWHQTHDVDVDMEPLDSEHTFTQIGSLYDERGGASEQFAVAYMTYFNGAYDGNTYSIKNVEINSKDTAVGLFGIVSGAQIRNVILYSDKGNYIQRKAESEKTWYTIGGLCGLASAGQGNSAEKAAITNCTVSGYTIQDNSTKSAWGDGSIGGMIGMSTLDLEQCTAVNTIVLNTVFTNAEGMIKSDGVSLRTGGLVGCMRGTITACYTGGEIVCTDACLENAKQSYGGKIFLGGITGGIYIKSGNFIGLLGNNILGIKDWSDDTNGNAVECKKPATIITDCYTYIRMPDSDAAYSVIKSIEPIGSNGETPWEDHKNYHVRVRIINCYYYENNIPRTKQFTVQQAVSGWSNSESELTNIDPTAQGISWKQLAGLEVIERTKENGGNSGAKTGFLEELLTDSGSGFYKVTTEEYGQSVKGKYSFPGNRINLDGEDYPFLTVLKQGKNEEAKNVHYGEWPQEGMYWKESRASMDIFENLVTETSLLEEAGTEENSPYVGWAIKTFDLVDAKGNIGTELGFKDFTFTYSNGEEEVSALSDGDFGVAAVVFSADTENPVEVFDSDTEEIFGSGTEEELAVMSGAPVETDDVFGDGMIRVFDTGMEVFETYSTKVFSDSREAQIAAYAQTEEETGKNEGEILEPSEYIAEVADITYNPEKKCYQAVVKALKAGTTVITATAVTGGTNPQKYTASFTLTVTADLLVYASPSTITQKVGDSTEVKMYAVPASVTDQNDADKKNLASNMKWQIETSIEGPVRYTVPDAKGCFTVTSESSKEVTLTLTGTYQYQQTLYTGIAWVDVLEGKAGEETSGNSLEQSGDFMVIDLFDDGAAGSMGENDGNDAFSVSEIEEFVDMMPNE